MKTNILRKIALLLAIVMVLGCFASCKSASDDSINELVDTNGVAGSEIDIEIPQGGNNNTDETPDEPTTEEPSTEEPSTNDEPTTEEPSTNDEPTTEEPSTNDQPSAETPDEEENYEDLFKEDEVEKPAYDASKAFKIISYNIKCAWYNKTIDQVASQLKEENADIVGLQECDFNTSRSGASNQVQQLAEKAGYKYWYFAPVIELGADKTQHADPNLAKNAYGHGILSKYPIVKSEIIWSEYQSKDGECRNFERHEIDVNGKIIAFYNTHADFSLGRQQYFEVQEKYMAKDKYAICVGDFNETYSEMNAYFDFDNFYNFSWGDDSTGKSQYYREKDGKKSEVIDHIIVSKDTFVWKDDEVKNGYYVRPHDGGSDHNMVYGYVNILD